MHWNKGRSQTGLMLEDGGAKDAPKDRQLEVWAQGQKAPKTSSFRFFAQVMVLELLISSSAPIGAYTFALETSLRCRLQNLINCLKTKNIARIANAVQCLS